MQIYNCIFFIRLAMEIRNYFTIPNIISPVNRKKDRYTINSIQADMFQHNIQSFKCNINLNDILDKKYENITEEEKAILRAEIEPFQYELINDCINAARIIKAGYDEKYGEDNWEYIAIGRSCANIAKALSHLGVKSYIIPISGLHTRIENGKEITQQEDFENYKNFIYRMGLNPQVISNSGKTYIFQDYCDSGKSLRIFEEFIRSDEMGLNKDNVKFERINDVLTESIPRLEKWGIKDFNPVLFIVSRLQAQSYFGSMKSYTSTPRLHYRDIGSIEEVTKKQVMKPYRLFDFGLEDAIKNPKYNPAAD